MSYDENSNKSLVVDFFREGTPKENALEKIVMALLVEVEALRSTLINIDQGKYFEAYKNATYLSHNAAGTFGGQHKTIELFFATNHKNKAREVSMLKRLGASDQEIEVFLSKCEEAEFFT